MGPKEQKLDAHFTLQGKTIPASSHYQSVLRVFLFKLCQDLAIPDVSKEPNPQPKF